MRAKLTDALLKKRTSPESSRDEIFDTQVPGFGIRIGQRDRSFFFIRRVHGEKVRFSLGQYPSVTLAQARARAHDILHQIKRGEDPREIERQRKKKAASDAENTFAVIANRFMMEYVRGKKTPLRARTAQGYAWALQGEATLKWRNKPLSAVSDRDIIEVVDGFEAQKKFASARLLRAYLHRFFKWTVEKRLIRENPATHIPLASTAADFRRDRVLSLPELRLILSAADNLEAAPRAFIRILVLCGQRRRETSLMKWKHLRLDDEYPLWSIPAENSKNRLSHDVPLSSEAVETLKGLPRIGDYVFSTGAGRRKKGNNQVNDEAPDEWQSPPPLSGFSKLKAKLDELIEADRRANWSEMVPMAHWTWHDLRRSAATGMADLGIAPHVIEEVLNHISGAKAGVAGLYNRSRYESERRQALSLWGRSLGTLRCGTMTSPSN